jgi:hypothetical protein
VAPLVVLETGDNRIFAAGDLGSGRGVAGDFVERVRLEVLGAGGEVEFGIDSVLIEIRFFEGLDP